LDRIYHEDTNKFDMEDKTGQFGVNEGVEYERLNQGTFFSAGYLLIAFMSVIFWGWWVRWGKSFERA
jgi:hypothetical protein